MEFAGELGTAERHISGGDQEYAIAASEDVVFSGAVQRIHRVTVEEERQEAGERHYPRESTRSRVVNEEVRSLNESVECEWQSLHSGRVRNAIGGRVCVGRETFEFNVQRCQPLTTLNFSPTKSVTCGVNFQYGMFM